MNTFTSAERAEGADYLREMESRGIMPPNFGGWLARNRRDMRWDYRHMAYMQSKFNAVTAGEIDNLALQVSGRHGKTEHITSYAVYLLEHFPTAEVIFATYNKEHATKMGRAIKQLGYKTGLPIEGTKPADSLWYVKGGGGLQCLGVDSGSASLNPAYILIDDPIGKRADAESYAHREKVWLWLTTDIMARVVPGVRLVFSMPRWHADDPMGRILVRQRSNWDLVDLPGRALEGDVLGREPGEMLWPEMRGEDFHAAQLAGGEYGYASFIQCRPRPREGAMFKWDWFKHFIDEVPLVGPFLGPLVRYWDTAGTDATGDNDPDWTAGALVCRMHDGRTALCDVARFRCGVAERDSRMTQVAVSDRKLYGSRVRWWIETETGIGGRERMQHLTQLIGNVGMSVQLDPRPRGTKPDLAQPLASKAQNGHLVLVRGDWNGPFLEEVVDFPGGKHDDQVDAARGADAKLSAPRASGVVGTIHV